MVGCCTYCITTAVLHNHRCTAHTISGVGVFCYYLSSTFTKHFVYCTKKMCRFLQGRRQPYDDIGAGPVQQLRIFLWTLGYNFVHTSGYFLISQTLRMRNSKLITWVEVIAIEINRLDGQTTPAWAISVWCSLGLVSDNWDLGNKSSETALSQKFELHEGYYVKATQEILPRLLIPGLGTKLW